MSSIIVADNLDVIGNVSSGSLTVDSYYPGQVIGYNFIRLDTQHSWVGPVGGETEMTELALVITPKKSNSILHCQWYLHGEANSHNSGFRVMVNGSLPADGFNTVTGYQNWSTLASDLYDGNDASTPRITTLHYIYSPGTTNQQTISPAYHSTTTSAYTYYLNRTAGSAGTNAYENGVTWGYVWEIAQ